MNQIRIAVTISQVDVQSILDCFPESSDVVIFNAVQSCQAGQVLVICINVFTRSFVEVSAAFFEVHNVHSR